MALDVSDGAIPALTRTCTIASSTPPSTPITAMASSLPHRNLNILTSAPSGALGIPLTNTSRHLECPFDFLHCRSLFSFFNGWLEHSLGHFDDSQPPISNRCGFCGDVFEGATGMDSWHARMVHVQGHHELGQKLREANGKWRVDSALHVYMWEKGLISKAVWKELMGKRAENTRRGNMMSPPASPTEESRQQVAEKNGHRLDGNVVFTTNTGRDRRREQKERQQREADRQWRLLEQEDGHD